MLTGEMISGSIKGDIVLESFEDFVGKQGVPPKRMIDSYMVLGPFVLETGGALETEYLYERHKVLDCDYLKSSGGEASVVPYIGLECANEYFGPPSFRFFRSDTHGGHLKFDAQDYNAGVNALYVTEQRNCVYYAAVYIECAKSSDAVICYEDSGSLLYLNGELIGNHPYGRVKGKSTYGNTAAVTFHKGKNLLMFKVRTGYICDTIDLTVSGCAIYPVIAKSGSMGLAYPMRTAAFTGSKERPLQVFPAFVGAFGAGTPGGHIRLECGPHEQDCYVGEMEAGSCRYVRLEVPSAAEPRTVKAKVAVTQHGETRAAGSFDASTVVFDGFTGTEHIYSDFHFDTTYHQEQRVYALGAIHIVKNMLEELRVNPGFKAILSEVDYLHPYYSVYPEDRQTLREMFAAGRAEADCFYNQPNEMTSSPEGLVRNLVYGQLYHRDVIGGGLTPVYGPGDVFGHPNQLSQICKKGGCIGVYWGKHILGFDCLFRHVSPDGTALIHSRGGTSKKDAMRLGITHAHQDSGLEPRVPAYPRDGDSEWMKQTLSHASFSVMSDFHQGVAEDDAKSLAQTGRALIEATSRDMSLYHAGVSLTRTDLKQANRLGENLLITAEKLAGIACLYGAKYPEKALDKAWRQLLCGQHHDSITGTNNEISFADLMVEYREAAELAADVVRRAAAYLASGVKLTQKGAPVFVFNPHTWERTDPCEVCLPMKKSSRGYCLVDGKGAVYPLQETAGPHPEGMKRVVFQPKVPAMGYSVFYLRENAQPEHFEAPEGLFIENAYYKIEADPAQGGGITSIYDKKARREVLRKGEDGPGNRVVILGEVPDRMETQHEFYTTGMKMFSTECRAQVSVEKGVNFQKLTVRYTMGTVTHIRQEITLFSRVRRIDFKTVVADYRGSDDLFTVTFPLAVRGARPVFDDRFAPAVRGESRRKLDFRTHQYAMFSHCQVYAANQWLDYGPSVTIAFNDGLHAVNVGMSALIVNRTPETAAAADLLLEALTKKAVPVTEYPDTKRAAYASQLVHFNEDLMMTDTRFVLAVAGRRNEYADRLLARCKPSEKERFDKRVAAGSAAVLFTRDSDNAWNKPVDVILIKAKTAKILRDFVEDMEIGLSVGRKIYIDSVILASAPGSPDDYGVALVNTGNLACSVENGGLLNLMLFHTARFYGNQGKVTGGEEMVPERKTHVFTYALIPHEGSYREAEIYRRALEVNDPLLGFTGFEKAAKAPLPESKSFLKTNGSFIVTAFKPGGYPLASMKGQYGDIYQRGFALRGFEPDGENAKAELLFGFDITGASSADLLEENAAPLRVSGNKLAVQAGAHSIETYLIRPKDGKARVGAAELGAEREPVEPTFVRSWEHDAGTMPMGYLAVAGFIGKKVTHIDETTFSVDVHIVNNRPDMPAEGTLSLRASKGFKLSRTGAKYSVPAGGYKVFPLKVTKPSAGAQGLITLEYSDDGQRFRDVFEIGCFKPEVSARIVSGGVEAEVANPTGQDLEGELALASPIETWDLYGFNPFAFAAAGPASFKVQLKAGAKQTFFFPVEQLPFEEEPSFWAVAKLMVNGRIFFAFAEKHGPRHNLWAHEMIGQIGADGNSIQRLLEL